MILVSGQDHTATGKPGSPWMRLPPISPDCHPSRTGNCASGSTTSRSSQSSYPQAMANMRAPIMSAYEWVVFAGSRASDRQPARRAARPRRFSISRSTSTPPSDDSRPPAALRSGVQAGLWSPARERSRSDVAADLVQARERPIMARTGAHEADDDRSVLRQLRARAPTHRARH